MPLTNCKCLTDQDGLLRLEKLRALEHQANEFHDYQSQSSQDHRNLVKEAEAIHIAGQLEEMIRKINNGIEIDPNASLEVETLISGISSRLNNTFEPVSIDEIHAGLWTSLR